eukprot:1197399-Pleurochrysis_carterae.AAC.1
MAVERMLAPIAFRARVAVMPRGVATLTVFEDCPGQDRRTAEHAHAMWFMQCADSARVHARERAGAESLSPPLLGLVRGLR